MNASMIKKAIWALCFCLFLSSCSNLNSIAINSTSGLMYSAAGAVETNANLDMIRAGLPGNLIMLEGLLSESKNNEELLATLTKGYVGYAYAINETEWLESEWQNKTSLSKEQALINYTKGFNFGLRYLKSKNINWNDLKGLQNDATSFQLLLSKNLTSKKIDLETVLFTAHSLGAMVNLQKDNIGLVAELTIVKNLFDWVCNKNPEINFGTCDIFYGTYESGRPTMLGGNPTRGKEIFEKAIMKYPNNWLIRTSYIQYYLVPQGNEAEFNVQMSILKNENAKFQNEIIYQANKLDDKQLWLEEEHLRFYQSLAMKRYELMDKYKKNLF